MPAEAAALYRDLRRMAAGLLNREPDGHTLQPTALVHEAFLRLVEESSGSAVAMNSLGALGFAMRVMRHVLVDHARQKKAEKRGGGSRAELLDGTNEPGEAIEFPLIDILALNDALDRYERIDPRGSQVVQFRFFAGMTVSEVATVLGISVSTAEEEWRVARAWLARELRAPE